MALILIADDDEIVVEIVREALGSRGHVVGAVDDGEPVMGILRVKKPKLLILDCNMPETSGMTVLRQIRTSPQHYTLPILMLTGRSNRQDEVLALTSGANDYIRKPFDPDQLVARVEDLLDRSQPQVRLASMRAPPRPARQHQWGVR